MLRYALTEEGSFISIEDKAPPPYYCPECLAPLGRKQGPERLWHFFHHEGEERSLCKQRRGTHEHRSLQTRLLESLNEHERSWLMEYPIPEAKRIADLANPSEKIAIELQRSSLSLDRLLQRTESYWKHGWRVMWLLSLSLFREGALPYQLQKLGTIPHYFFEGNDPLPLWEIVSFRKGKTMQRKLSSLVVQKRESRETYHPFWKHCTNGKKRIQWTLGIKGDFLDEAPREKIDFSHRPFRMKTALSLLWLRLIGT